MIKLVPIMYLKDCLRAHYYYRFVTSFPSCFYLIVQMCVWGGVSSFSCLCPPPSLVWVLRNLIQWRSGPGPLCAPDGHLHWKTCSFPSPQSWTNWTLPGFPVQLLLKAQILQPILGIWLPLATLPPSILTFSGSSELQASPKDKGLQMHPYGCF